MMNDEIRQCRGCKRTLRLDQFYRYSKKRETRRRICKDCSRLRRDIWLTKVSPERKEKYYGAMKVAHDRRQEELKVERARDVRDRINMMQGIIRTMRDWGMTHREIAQGSGISLKTVGVYGRGDKVQYSHRAVLDRLSRFYQQELERRKI